MGAAASARRGACWVLAMVLAACGGGGGGSPPAPEPTPEPVVVAGRVAAPDGTAVDLVRVTPTGAPGAVLASTRVASGRYRFDLTALGVSPAAELMLRATPAGGPAIRALAASTLVDVGVGTEAFVQWATQRIAASQAGAGLAGLTAIEAAGLQGSAHLKALLDGAAAGPPTQAAIDAARDRLAGNARFGAALDAALSPATALDGPGDLLELAPLAVGNRWSFDALADGGNVATPLSAVAEAGEVPGSFRVVGSLGTVDTYAPRPDGLYLVRSGTGADDDAFALIGEYPQIDFPPVPGRTRTVRSGSGIAVPDLDGDGRAESMDFALVRTEEGVITTTLTLSDGTAARAMRIRDEVTVTLRASRGVTAQARGTSTIDVVPAVGPARQTTAVQASADGAPVGSETETLILTAWSRAPVAVPLVHRRIVHDPSRGVAYASVPSAGGGLAERVATIDLATRTVTASSAPFPAGSDPDQLALAGDGRSLYVSLAGSGSVARLALPSLAVLQVFPLAQVGDVNPPWRATSLATSPVLPDVVAVSLADPLRATQGVGIYAAGQRLPGRGGCALAVYGDGCRVLFATDGSPRLFAFDDNTTRNTLSLWFVEATAGASLEGAREATDIVSGSAPGRSDPSWLRSGGLLAPDGTVYDAGSLQPRGPRAPSAEGCTALAREAWFVCRDVVSKGEFPLFAFGADGTSRRVAALRIDGAASRGVRLLGLGAGRIGVSDAASPASPVFERLLLIEGGPY